MLYLPSRAQDGILLRTNRVRDIGLPYPTVICRQTAKRRLKQCAMVRQPAAGISALRRMISCRTQAGLGCARNVQERDAGLPRIHRGRTGRVSRWRSHRKNRMHVPTNRDNQILIVTSSYVYEEMLSLDERTSATTMTVSSCREAIGSQHLSELSAGSSEMVGGRSGVLEQFDENRR